MMNEIIAEVAEIYRKMSLRELLVEENLIAKFWHTRVPDVGRKRLREILRSEIEKKLR